MTPAGRTATHYGLAVLISVSALAITGVSAFPFGGASLYIPLVGVFFVALNGGFGPGVLAAVLCALGFDFFYLGRPMAFGGETRRRPSGSSGSSSRAPPRPGSRRGSGRRAATPRSPAARQRPRRMTPAGPARSRSGSCRW